MSRQHPDSPSFRQAGADPLNPLGDRTADPVTMAASGCLPWMPSLAHNPLMPISTIYALSIQHVSWYLVDTSLAMPGHRLWVFSNCPQSSGYLATPRSTGHGISIGTDRYTGRVRERWLAVTRCGPAKCWKFSRETTLQTSPGTGTLPASYIPSMPRVPH